MEESPLFGQHEIIISEVIYQSGDFVYYHDNGLQKLGRLRAIMKDENGNYELRVQLILNYDDLPENLKGLSRRRHSLTGEIWFQDELFIIIMTSQILEKVTIMMMYQHQIIPEGSLRITEIIYKCNDCWHICDVKLSYQHPSDYISVKNPPLSIPVYKLFLDLYYSNFGTFRNVYHSLGGIYVQFGNMATHQRKLIKNHFVLRFIPFGGNFNEQDAWVIAGLGLVTADLPQGKDIAGVLRHNANKGCSTCTIKKKSLSTYNQDRVITLHYHHITDEEISKISQKSVSSKREQLCTEYGLRSLPSILDKLKCERYLQMPQDIYHTTAKKIGRLLKLTCKLFSQEGEDDFIKIWKNFKIPKNLVLKAIISCWVQVAKIMKAVFNKEFTLYSYKELQLCLKKEFLILPKVFASFVNLPNIYINMHLLMYYAKTFSILFVNSQVDIKEMVHHIFKGMNFKKIKFCENLQN
ncbi:hypothetical protein C1646_754223 [Rhizophagus diaphanus]|nr:hypothetical protein C1646_754223 [Rhizophagus diaphanus] [Rhizophagus sp. MUCL 43196]